MPCIVTQGVGLGGIIESYGAGYQSENTIEDISKTIERFIQNIDNLGNLSQSAIRLINDNFDVDMLAKMFLAGAQNIEAKKELLSSLVLLLLLILLVF